MDRSLVLGLLLDFGTWLSLSARLSGTSTPAFASLSSISSIESIESYSGSGRVSSYSGALSVSSTYAGLEFCVATVFYTFTSPLFGDL